MTGNLGLHSQGSRVQAHQQRKHRARSKALSRLLRLLRLRLAGLCCWRWRWCWCGSRRSGSRRCSQLCLCVLQLPVGSRQLLLQVLPLPVKVCLRTFTRCVRAGPNPAAMLAKLPTAGAARSCASASCSCLLALPSCCCRSCRCLSKSVCNHTACVSTRHDCCPDLLPVCSRRCS